jgi:hypothetical protein
MVPNPRAMPQRAETIWPFARSAKLGRHQGGHCFGRFSLKKVREYRQRACECRNMGAKASTPDLKEHYIHLAQTWDKLAAERLTFFVEHPDADGDEEAA